MRFTTSSEKHQNPVWVSPEEMDSPGDFIRNFCDSWNLSDCRFYLWQMLSNSISYEFPHTEASAGGQIFFFENVMAMIESVYLLNSETSESQTGKQSTQDSFKNSEFQSPLSDEDPLNKVLSIIRQVAPVEKIFLVSCTKKHSASPEFDFIVLTESNDPKSNVDYEAAIKNLTSSVASVRISIFKISYVELLIENG